MTRVFRIAALATVIIASPLAAQHNHPAPAGASPVAPHAAPRDAMRPAAPGGDSAAFHSMMGGMMGNTRGGAMGTMMADMDSMMGPVHSLLAFAPQALLAQRAVLRLDDEQSSRVAAIQARSEAAHDSAMAGMAQHRRAFGEAVARGENFGSIAPHLEAIHWSMGQAHLALLRAAVDARAVLTAGQREQVGASAPQHGDGLSGPCH